MTQKPGSRKGSDFNYGRYFRDMLVLHDLTTFPQDAAWARVLSRDPEPHPVVFYLGCNVLRTSHMVRTAMRILDLLEVDYVAVGGPAYCCGVVHQRFGDEELAQTMGRNAVRSFERFRPERVVMWCPSCIWYYDEICQVPASFKTQHFSEFLVERLGEFRFTREVPQRVTLHYHCNRPRRLQEAQAAEALLSAVPGVQYVRISSDTRLDRACSEFTQQALGGEVWQQIVGEQLREAAEAGAATFATMYHGCQRVICPFEEQRPLVIEHYLSIFARALGIEEEDLYKKYRLWQDPQRVLEDMAPCMRAHGIKPDLARDVVQRSFPTG